MIFSGYFMEIGLVKLLVTNGANLGTVFYLGFHIYFYKALQNSFIMDSIASISMLCPPCHFLFCTFSLYICTFSPFFIDSNCSVHFVNISNHIFELLITATIFLFCVLLCSLSSYLPCDSFPGI